MHACENAGVKTHIGAKRDWVVKKSPFFCFFFVVMTTTTTICATCLSKCKRKEIMASHK